MRFAIPVLTATALFAAEPVDVWSTAQLRVDSAKLVPAPRIAGNTLGAWGSHSASLWKRTSSGEAELHRLKTDLMIVEEGSATFLYGGSIIGAHGTAPGEIRGTSIADGHSRKLAPGDIVHVAPGTPHQFILDKGQSITYVAVKIAR